MTGSKFPTILVWVLRALVALAFGMAGTHKLAGDPMMVGMFDKIGFGQGFRYFTGVVEVASAALVLWPRTSLYAAMAMLCVLVGALITQIFVLHGDVIHVFVLAAVVLLLVWRIRAGGSPQIR